MSTFVLFFYYTVPRLGTRYVLVLIENDRLSHFMEYLDTRGEAACEISVQVVHNIYISLTPAER